MNRRNPEEDLLDRYVSSYGIAFGDPNASSSRNQAPRTPPPSRHSGTSNQASYASIAAGRGHVNSGSNNFGPPFPDTHRKQSVQRHREPPPPPTNVMIPKEVVIITAELHKKLRNASPFTAPFYHKPPEESPQSSHHQQHLTQTQHAENPTLKSWKWMDESYVRIPLSKNYIQDDAPKWNLIEDILIRFKSACLDGITATTNHHHWLRKTISLYNSKAADSSNFGVVQNDVGIVNELLRQMPGIIDHAIKLPWRLQTPIPILKRGESRTIYLTRDLACSLLANAFLCTFPEQEWRIVPYFHFYSVFDEVESSTKTQVKREKVKCMLKYFAALAEENPYYPNTIVSYERRHVPTKFNWSASTDQLSKIEITSEQRLENNVGMLQVDFANKWIGGGVLNEGAVQEEIRFVISPELIIARLFTEPLDDDEVLVVTGTAQYSSYTGYSGTFKCADLPNYKRVELDNLGRERTQVVAMDALFFKPNEIDKQYGEDKLKRELHKCYVAFIPGRHPTPVATGLWGCGCFNGDPQLKFLIQWMAASVHRRPVLFHSHNDKRLRDEFIRIAQFLVDNKVNVGKLYRILCRYSSSCVEGRNVRRKPVFEFVAQEAGPRFWGGGMLGRGG